MIKPEFLPDAEAEFLKEIAYYSNAREGLGIKFREAVMVAVAKAVATRWRHAFGKEHAQSPPERLPFQRRVQGKRQRISHRLSCAP